MFAGDPAHFISATNRAQFRPASVVGLSGKRQPLGIGSASSLREYGRLQPQCVKKLAVAMRRAHGIVGQHAVVPRISAERLAVELADSRKQAQRRFPRGRPAMHGFG